MGQFTYNRPVSAQFLLLNYNLLELCRHTICFRTRTLSMQGYKATAAKLQADIHRPVLSENIMATQVLIPTIEQIHGTGRANH